MQCQSNSDNFLFILETLPKPYIPSAVPFFTGREVEIKGITNLITGQSTRLLNIWGSPGFGKTSTAIGAAHHLVSLGYPVYFFKLHGVSTVEEFLSKILGIFKSNLVDRGLKPIDKVVSIFREISCQIFLIFDNLDNLLSSESRCTKLKSVFEELLDSSVNINVMFTTRELLGNLLDHIEGFQDIRIRPLNPVSSVKFVRQLLSTFSENVIAKVAEICSHVPLAMKLVASLVENNTEDIANEILKELSLSGDMLGGIDSSYEKKMKNLFKVPFEQLTLNDKHALISLTVFACSTISKDAAIAIVSGEKGVAKGVRSLKTLVIKSLIDEDSSGENYSIHPLIYSFVIDKAIESDVENVYDSSIIRYCNYYLLRFEKFNDDFLAGKLIDSPQLQDTMDHLPFVMHQSLTSSLHDLIRILSKCEIFLFLLGFARESSADIPNLYDLAIEKCSLQKYDSSKLYISKCFLDIVPSLFASNITVDIPEHIREDVRLLSDGCAAKLGCYEGILLIVKGENKSGAELIEKHLDDLEICPDQQLLKCLCLQLLALYCTNLNEHSKSNNFSKKAIEVCEKFGNYNLLLISSCEQSLLLGQNECKGEQLILFVYLLLFWSKAFISDETRMHFFNLLYGLDKQLGNKSLYNSHYLFSVVRYGDFVLAVLGKIAGQPSFLEEKIHSLDNSFKSELANRTFPKSSEVGTLSSKRLFYCCFFKMAMDRDEICPKKSCDKVETCRKALDLSLKHNGKQHGETAFCYLKLGQAETAAENYISALYAFDQVIEILKSSNNNDVLNSSYVDKGKVYKYMYKYDLAVESFEEALKRTKLPYEDAEKTVEILILLGDAQWHCDELTSALATFQQALNIMVNPHTNKCCSFSLINIVYCMTAQVHHELGNSTECVNFLKKALQTAVDCNDEQSVEECFIFSLLLNWELDERLERGLYKCAPRMVSEKYKPLCTAIHLKFAEKQFVSDKQKDGLTSLQEAFNIKLDDILLDNAGVREYTGLCYVQVAATLVNIGKFKLAKKAVNRAAKIAESLPECKQHFSVFLCYKLKGLIHNEMRQHAAAIDCLRHALLQLPKFFPDAIDKFHELECRYNIGKAYFYEGSYQDALTSFYNALSIVKDLFPEGSENEGNLYHCVATIANEMKNKRLEVNNLRLAYKMYSKVLGSNHSSTEQCYIEYARALINRIE